VSAEILRRINNLVQIGTVTESKSADGLALARVNVLGRVTDFLPVMQSANSFKSHAAPIRAGEQVVVLSPYGDGDSGVIIGSLFNKGCKEPSDYSDTTEVLEYEDGTRIFYDTKDKVLTVDAANAITVKCKSATLYADTVDISATTSHIGNVSIDGSLDVSGDVSSGGNVVTAGTVTDSRGDLTNFSTTDGASRA